MAHPDHDQVIGRLAGARLRGTAGRRSGVAPAEAHPDPETWAAYVDGGLRSDEVARLDDHLAGCGPCRRLVASLAPEVSATPAAIGDAAVAPTGRAAVLAFRRRQVFAWMGVAAALFAAVTLWSVARLGNGTARVADVAESVDRADPPPSSLAHSNRPAQQPASPQRRSAQAEVDTRQRVPGGPAASGRDEAKAAAGALGAAPAGGTRRESAQVAAASPAEDKRLADGTPVAATPVDARQIQLQTNTAAAGAARAHGPIATQATNTQQNAPIAPPAPPPSPPASAAPVAGVQAPSRPPPPTAEAEPLQRSQPRAAFRADAAKATAPADAAAVAARERRENEQRDGLAEVVATTGSAAGARPVPTQPAPQAAATDRSAALAKDDAATVAAFGVTALKVFAEPGGRLTWRIVDGRRLESSSDGGVTWTARPLPRGARLRAGTAPAIDSAWAVGEHGLVLRLTVPGGWAAVTPPGPVTLIAVSATSAQSARVTADDGRVFETADGGATWNPVTPGAGPQ